MTRPEEIVPADALEGLEACTTPGSAFHHAHHVAAAWEALRLQPFEAAAARLCRALRRFAAHNGKAERFDEALTLGFLRLIDRRRGALSWEAFCAAAPELLVRDDALARQAARSEG